MSTITVPVTLHLYYRQPSGRYTWGHDKKHTRRDELQIPDHLAGIVERLDRRAGRDAGFQMHGIGPTVSLVAWSRRSKRVGGIANVRLDNLQPPYEARKDVDTKQLTFVPDALNDFLRTYSKWQFLQAFSNDQLQPWQYTTPRPNPEYERGLGLLCRILKVAHPGKLTLKQLERLATDAERMAAEAR